MNDTANKVTAVAPATLPGAGGEPSAHPDAEARLDRRILHGIGWSFLVSVFTLPFGYLISIVLARVSPEAVGIYSVLGIYLGIVSTILYLGGGTVSVRFMAELPGEKRLPFFFSYYALTLVVTGCVLVLFSAFPGLLRLLLGTSVDPDFFRLLMLSAPVPLFFFAVLAALRGMMSVAFAQALMRSVTFGACVFYGYLLLFHRSFFQRQYAGVIVISYLVLMLLVDVVGFRRFWNSVPHGSARPSWLLPAGFWSFALAVQIPSALALLHQKMDEMFVLRVLGLSQLGIYFVLSQLSGSAELLINFFVDGVFPALFTFQATGRLDKTEELHGRVARYILAISATTIFFLIAFASPLLHFLGQRYASSHSVFLLLLLFATLDCLGPLNHTYIVGMKKLNSWSVVQTTRLVGFVVLFTLLAGRYGLLGVVLARGFAWMLAGALAYWIALKRLALRISIPRQYFLYVAISAALVALCYGMRDSLSGWGWSTLLFVVATGSFLLLGGYGPAEFHQLIDLRRGEGK